MDEILHIENMTKLYKNGRGVKNITLSVNRGDIVGLLGPNGSGKTTTMKTVVGLCKPTSGEISVFGLDLNSHFEDIMERIGVLIEAPALYGYLSAYRNLKLMSNFYPNVDDRRIDKVLEIVHLSQYKNDKVSRFSLGMKQRLGLAMALLSEPELIILDEPANGLDIEGMVEIREIIRALAEKYGVTFLVSSHLAGEIEKTCTRVAIIHEGDLVDACTMDEALAYNPTLEDYFLTVIKENRGDIVV
jgi:ABC-2 type transport system ATP-binding protein